MKFSTFSSAAALIGAITVQAHPGHDVQQEVRERAEGLAGMKRDISHCAEILKKRGIQDRTVKRRTEVLRREREKRGLNTAPHFITARDLGTIEKRDGNQVLNATHLSPIDYSPDTPLDVLFAGNQSCILVPETTEGPYYVSGEYVREDVREAPVQKGVDLILDILVLDTSTCEPVPDIYVEFWQANATGIYSGVIANGNNGGAENINATFQRGIRPTNSEGVTQFTAYYPGHYTGRTEHIHVATHLNGSVLPNNTFAGQTISHVGQIFFDTSLTALIAPNPIYAINQQPVTTNIQDSIFFQEAATGHDPVAHYSLLSADVDDGVFAWIAIGIDPQRNGSIRAAARLTAGGGVGGGGGGPGRPGGPPGGNGTFTMGPRPTVGGGLV